MKVQLQLPGRHGILEILCMGYLPRTEASVERNWNVPRRQAANGQAGKVGLLKSPGAQTRNGSPDGRL